MSPWAAFIAVCAVLAAVCIGIAIWTAADDRRRWKRSTRRAARDRWAGTWREQLPPDVDRELDAAWRRMRHLYAEEGR